jgi:hypothetical protein
MIAIGPPSLRPWRRSDGSGVCARRHISRRFRRAFCGYFCKRSAVLVEFGILACKGLPAKYSDVYVGRIDLDCETGAARQLLNGSDTTTT